MRGVKTSLIAILAIGLVAGQWAPTLALDRSGAADEGTLATPLGPMSWAHVSTEGRRFPPSSQVIETPAGLAVFEHRVGGRRPHRLWLSIDGVDWRAEELDVTAGGQPMLAFANDAWWLVNGLRLWRSTDAETWTPVGDARLEPPGPVGFDWSVYYGEPVGVGGNTIIPMNGSGSFPGTRLGYPKCTERPVRTDEDGVYRMRHDEKCRNNGPLLRFVETATGLRVIDTKNGKRIGRIGGADLGHIEVMTQTDEFNGSRLVVVDGDDISYVEAPWGGRASFTLHSPTPGDRALAYVQHWDDDEAGWSVWSSDDGRSWEDVTDMALPTDLPVDADIRIHPRRDGISITAERWHDMTSTFLGGWDSSDGLTWVPMPRGWPEGTRPLRAASGWFATETFDRYGPVPGDSLWMHVGDEWVSLAGLGFDCSLDPERIAKATHIEASTSVTLVWAAAGCESEGEPRAAGRSDGRDDLWVLRDAISG